MNEGLFMSVGNPKMVIVNMRYVSNMGSVLGL